MQKELSLYFQPLSSYYLGRLISVSSVKVSADLSLAKAYLSIFPLDEDGEVFNMIMSEKNKIKFNIGNKLRNQLRKIPELDFFTDNSIEQAERINKLLSK